MKLLLMLVLIAAGLLSEAKLAEFLTDNIAPLSDNNAVGDMKDEVDTVSLENQNEEDGKVQKGRNSKLSDLHKFIEGRPGNKKVKPPPALSKYQRNVLIAFAAQVCAMYYQFALMTHPTNRSNSLRKRNRNISHSSLALASGESRFVDTHLHITLNSNSDPSLDLVPELS